MSDHDHADEILRYGECLTCIAAHLEAEAAEPAPGIPQPTADFDGATYDRRVDHVRLEGQVKRVYDVMLDGEWRTLEEIGALTRDPAQSISARIRDLRKQKFGGHTVKRRRRGPREAGVWEYRLIPAGRLL